MKKTSIVIALLVTSFAAAPERARAGTYLGRTTDVWIFYASANFEHAILNQLNHPLYNSDYGVLHAVHEDLVGAYAAYVIYGYTDWTLQYIAQAYYTSTYLSAYFDNDPAIALFRLYLLYAYVSLL